MKREQSFDARKAETFGGSLIDMLNQSSLALMTSIGHRTRLFDNMAEMPFATSTEIADKAGLNERYVREWLGAMVTGGVIDYAAETKTYNLPAEHAASLTRKSGSDNFAVFTQYVAIMGMVEDDILACFKNGGGVPYSKFHRFHEVMAEDSGQSVLSSLESHILPLVPNLISSLNSGITMVDIGCGSGKIINELASLFPASHFTGIDISEEALASARLASQKKRLDKCGLYCPRPF